MLAAVNVDDSRSDASNSLIGLQQSNWFDPGGEQDTSACRFLDVPSSAVHDADRLVAEEGTGLALDEVHIGVTHCCGG